MKRRTYRRNTGIWSWRISTPAKIAITAGVIGGAIWLWMRMLRQIEAGAGAAGSAVGGALGTGAAGGVPSIGAPK